MVGHGLGRLIVHDDRDRNYLMADILPKEAPKITQKAWKTGPVLDQGQHPYCVGFGTEAWLNAEPLETMDGPTPLQIYRGAQSVDGIPGKHDGSTVRAALKWLQGQKRVKSYHWAYDAETAVRWILARGTVITGLQWFTGMEDPLPNGQMRLTGEIIGGHCTCWYGADLVRGIVNVQNSWGTGWANGGRAFMTIEDFDTLIKADG